MQKIASALVKAQKSFGPALRKTGLMVALVVVKRTQWVTKWKPTRNPSLRQLITINH